MLEAWRETRETSSYARGRVFTHSFFSRRNEIAHSLILSNGTCFAHRKQFKALVLTKAASYWTSALYLGQIGLSVPNFDPRGVFLLIT